MGSLIWAFAVRICPKTSFRTAWSIWPFHFICWQFTNNSCLNFFTWIRIFLEILFWLDMPFLSICYRYITRDVRKYTFGHYQNIHSAHLGYSGMQSFFMRTTKTLIRLCGCAGWFESSLGAYVRRYVFWRCGASLYDCFYFISMQVGHDDTGKINGVIATYYSEQGYLGNELVIPVVYGYVDNGKALMYSKFHH